MKQATSPLYFTRRDRRRSSFGDEVATFAEGLGWVPMEWQVAFWDAALEYRKAPGVGLGHTYARRQAVCTLPRQNGKSVALLALAGWAGMRWPKMRIAWIAQERRVATENLRSLFTLLAEQGVQCSFVNTMGHERIRFDFNGSSIEVQSATRRAGHGASWDLAVCDETWSLSYDVLQSVAPAQAARPSALLCMISTQGTEDSSVLNDLCDRGRTGDKDLTFMEFAAEDTDDVFNEELWWKWMPALTQSRFVTVEAIRSGASLFAKEPKEFVRAYGNRMVSSDERVFQDGHIEGVVSDLVPKASDRVWIGVDVSRAPDSGAVAAAWLGEDDRMYGRVLEQRMGPDTAWVGPSVQQFLRQKPKAKVVIGAGPSILVEDELESFADLTDLSTTSVAGAAMRFAEYVYTGEATFADLGGCLVEALGVAKPKTVGDRWRFDRATFGVDQSPLIALSLAVNQTWVDSFEPTPTINGIPIGATL